MKKLTLLVFSIVALISSACAQVTVVGPTFTNNPEKFNGKTISVEVNIRPKTTVPTISVGGPSTVSTGTGTSANTVAKCNAPRGFKALDVDFVNDPSFAKCFFISNAMFATLPIAQDAIKSTITFKGDAKVGYTISLVKF
jgi:hypothetical protein